MATNRKTPYKERVASEIIEALKAGTAPWVKPWRPGEIITPRNATTVAAYRGINTLMLAGAGYNDPRWVTYKQAEGQGWQVRKGERGRTVQYWKWPTAEETAAASAEGRTVRPRAFYATVFNAGQVDGIPPWAASEPDWQASEAAERLLGASGARLVHDQRDRAFYHPAADEIHLPPRSQFDNELAYYETALHELGHWTGHPSRMDRDLSGAFGQEGYAREELRAEITSYMLAGKLGLGFDPGNHLAYVDHWITLLEKDPQEIFRASADAEKISDYLLSMGQEKAPAETNRAATHTEAEPGPLDYTVAGAPAPTSITSQGDAREKVYLAVPFTEKDAAKTAGARWDRRQKTWYITGDQDPQAFNRWSLDAGTRSADLESPQPAFATFCREAGLLLTGAPVMDGTLQRAAVEGDHSAQRSGAYVGHLDGHPAGYVQNFKTGEKQNWQYEHAPSLSAAERAQQRADITRKHKAQAEKHRADHQRTASEATQKIAELQAVEQPTPYMRSKGLAVGAGALTDQTGTKTYLPLRDIEGKVWSLQTIDAEGNKRFLKGGKKQGCYFVAGATHPTQDVCWIAEGFATAATVSRALNEPVIVAFDAGNLKAVAEAMHQKHPKQTICILADNDKVGQDKAQAAASAVEGIVLAPQFAPSETGKDFSDWNDLAHHSQLGGDAVRTQVTHGIHNKLKLTPNTDQEPAALKATLRNAYLHTDKAAAIEAHPEIEPLYQFEVAATQFVAANKERFSDETRETFVRTVCEKALDVLARGEILPDKPNLRALPAPPQKERGPELAPGL